MYSSIKKKKKEGLAMIAYAAEIDVVLYEPGAHGRSRFDPWSHLKAGMPCSPNWEAKAGGLSYGKTLEKETK